MKLKNVLKEFDNASTSQIETLTLQQVAHAVVDRELMKIRSLHPSPEVEELFAVVGTQTPLKPLSTPILPAVAGNGAVGVVGGDPVSMPTPKPQ